MTNREEIRKALAPEADAVWAEKRPYKKLLEWCRMLLTELEQVTEQRDIQYPGGLPALLAERDRFKAEVERLRADNYQLSERVKAATIQTDHISAPSPCRQPRHSGPFVDRRKESSKVRAICSRCGYIGGVHGDPTFAKACGYFRDRRQHDLGGHCEPS